MKVVTIKDMTFADAYVQIFNLLDDCVLVVDVDGKIVLYNSASEHLDGLKKERVIGKHISESFLINRHSSSTLCTLQTKKSCINMYQDYTTLLGKRISTVSSSYPLIKNNEMLGVLTITKDITRFKEMLRVFQENHSKPAEPAGETPPVSFADIKGESKALKSCIAIARSASKTGSNTMLYGETGTGKELFAQSIHNESQCKGNFVPLNCAAIPENLLESLLFGTARGAFTGAVNKPGLFEEATNGTLFLDELNSMSMNLQAKLLRAIETGKIRRVGENKEIIVKTRIICALNIHPMEAIEENLLRKDLFYRLGSVVIHIPPLRARTGDIEHLTKIFIDKYNKKFSKNVKGLSKDVTALFQKHSWQGNVRELEHAIEHGMIVAENSPVIEMDHIPIFIQESVQPALEATESGTLVEKLIADIKSKDIATVMGDLERMVIEKSLAEVDGNVAQAAKNMGINRQTLDYRIKKLLSGND